MKKSKVSILLVDDDQQIHFLFKKFLEKWFNKENYSLHCALSPEVAQKEFLQTNFHMVFVDLHFHSEPLGYDFVKWIRGEDATLPIIVISSVRNFESAQLALRAGASDYLPKGFNEAELYYAIEKAMERHDLLRMANHHVEAAKQAIDRYKIIGENVKITKLRDQIKQLAKSKVPILIQAETGSGKELVARNLHYFAEEPSSPFVVLDCTTIPLSMAEALLFGHEKGAFTGATQSKAGIFEQADGGTLFIDELASLSMDLQVKLLRVLQEKEIRRVGGNKTISVDFRIIAATNTSIDKLIRDGMFKADLFYRIQSVILEMPPLRDRMDDLAELTKYFLPNRKLSDELWDLLKRYSWPGNVRELQNFLLGIDAMAASEAVLDLHHVSEPFLQRIVNTLEDHSEEVLQLNFKELSRRHEMEFLNRSYIAAQGNISKMARMLNVDRSHLHEKLKSFGIHSPKRL